MRCVYELKERLDVPIIGCGGVATWEDAVRFLLEGASAVQLGTATVKKFQRFNDLNIGVISYMERKGIARLGDPVGAAHRGGIR